MNTNENSTQEIWFCKFQNFGISQSFEIYQKFPFSNFVSKCVKDKLEQDAWLPLPHGSSFASNFVKSAF